MSDQHTYREHARDLLQRAATERDRGRQRYLRGLARSYEQLALQHEPERPAMAQQAGLVALLRRRGFTEAHIAGRLGCSPQLVSQLMREAARVDRT
jgi:hypothetical protein